MLSVGSPWGWGYYSYWNPYWVAPVGGVTYINYSQPIVVAPPVVVAPQPTVAVAAGPTPAVAAAPTPAVDDPDSREKALELFENARALFKRGDYQLALTETDRAVALMPNDSLMHEFRALCLFALGDYKQSAAAMYAVLSGGPGWDAATLEGLYPNEGVYTEHLRALENYRNQHLNAADARFLLAYHYLLADKEDAAAAELAAVVELEPKDQLSAQLLKGLSEPAPDDQPVGPTPAESDEPVAAASLVGNWQATRSDGSKFELNLSDDNKFNWKCKQQDKDQQLSGTYTVANNYLILSASGDNALVGRVSLAAADTMRFKLAGGAPSDPGLTFTR